MSSLRLPLYAQVDNVIMDRISNGSLPAGSGLPSEDSLVQEYAVSRTTIRTYPFIGFNRANWSAGGSMITTAIETKISALKGDINGGNG